MVKVEEKSERETIKSNKSLYFVLPMIGLIYYNMRNIIINSYLGDRINRPNLENYHIFVLAKTEDQRLLNIKEYIEHYPHGEYFMFVYKIPEEYEEDYLKFILGQYSQFSIDYKTQIVKLLPVPYQIHTVFKVIMKTEEARKIIEEKVGQSIGDQEVFSIPNMEEEIYG